MGSAHDDTLYYEQEAQRRKAQKTQQGFLIALKEGVCGDRCRDVDPRACACAWGAAEIEQLRAALSETRTWLLLPANVDLTGSDRIYRLVDDALGTAYEQLTMGGKDG